MSISSAMLKRVVEESRFRLMAAFVEGSNVNGLRMYNSRAVDYNRHRGQENSLGLSNGLVKVNVENGEE